VSQGHKTLAMRILDTLAEAGTWRGRGELREAHSCSEVALDDALADLVMDSRISYRENVGYRLAGTTLARRALQIASRERRTNQNRRRFMTRNFFHERAMRIGFAEVREVNGEEQLVGYELEFDKAVIDGADVNEQVANLIAIADKFLTGGAAHGGTGV
jgi:hypothetical protein